MNQIAQLQNSIQEARQCGDTDGLEKLISSWEFMFNVMEHFDLDEDEYLQDKDNYDNEYLEDN